MTAVAVLMLAACGGSTQGSSGGGGYGGGSGSGGATPTPAPNSQGQLIKTATATVRGQSETIFTNSAGKTLYYFLPDKDQSVTCQGECTAEWPPLTAPAGTSTPATMAGVTGMFATDPGPSGASVVTYNGWPLYTFSDDDSPGQVKGDGLDDSGGLWYVATPSLAATPTGQ